MTRSYHLVESMADGLIEYRLNGVLISRRRPRPQDHRPLDVIAAIRRFCPDLCDYATTLTVWQQREVVTLGPTAQQSAPGAEGSAAPSRSRGVTAPDGPAPARSAGPSDRRGTDRRTS